MTRYDDDSSVRLQKYISIIFGTVIFTSLLLLAVKQERKITFSNKPHCLKGYICQAAMKNIGR